MLEMLDARRATARRSRPPRRSDIRRRAGDPRIRDHDLLRDLDVVVDHFALFEPRDDQELVRARRRHGRRGRQPRRELLRVPSRLRRSSTFPIRNSTVQFVACSFARIFNASRTRAAFAASPCTQSRVPATATSARRSSPSASRTTSFERPDAAGSATDGGSSRAPGPCGDPGSPSLPSRFPTAGRLHARDFHGHRLPEQIVREHHLTSLDLGRRRARAARAHERRGTEAAVMPQEQPSPVFEEPRPATRVERTFGSWTCPIRFDPIARTARLSASAARVRVNLRTTAVGGLPRG